MRKRFRDGRDNWQFNLKCLEFPEALSGVQLGQDAQGNLYLGFITVG